MKCLEKDRNRRYETASSLARDVERYLHDEPVQACPPSTTYRLKKFVRRNKVAAAFVALLLASVVAGLAISNIAIKRERDAKATALSRKRPRQAVSDLLQEMLGSADPDTCKGTPITRSANCWMIFPRAWAVNWRTSRRSRPTFARRLAAPIGSLGLPDQRRAALRKSDRTAAAD